MQTPVDQQVYLYSEKINICILLFVLVLDDELPMTPVGPLRKYRPLVVLHTSILTPQSSSIVWEGPVPLCTLEKGGIVGTPRKDCLRPPSHH